MAETAQKVAVGEGRGGGGFLHLHSQYVEDVIQAICHSSGASHAEGPGDEVAKFDCPVARQNSSLLATAHDCETGLLFSLLWLTTDLVNQIK